MTMFLTDYYKFSHNVPGIKSKTRYNCITSTGEYEPFEILRRGVKNNCLYIYYGDNPPTFKKIDPRRDAGKSIRHKANISGVFMPDITNYPYKGYGDTKGTGDALLFLFNGDYTEIEIFVARGHKGLNMGLWQEFIDGELDGELEVLRKGAASRQGGGE